MAWYDIYKLWKFTTELDSIEKQQQQMGERGAGITSPEVPQHLLSQSQEGSQGSPLKIRMGDSTDFIDLSSVTNRISRYKEYDRLQSTAEIETALNTFADEACVAGNTLITTLFGEISIEELSKTKSPEEKFIVYAWDFSKGDYTLAWAYNPRKVKTAKTLRILLSDGTSFICTEDHRVLLKNQEWSEAKNLAKGSELMPFYKIKANTFLSGSKTNQFPRVFTFNKGWVHERQFIDEWKTNKDIPKYDKVNRIVKFVQHGLNLKQLQQALDSDRKTIDNCLKTNGFSRKELNYLVDKYSDTKHVVGVLDNGTIPVYDLSVEGHQNFAGNGVILHNCQENDDGHVFKVKCENEHIKKEAEILLRKILHMDDRAWGTMKNLCKYGDSFFELIIDPYDPKKYGVIGIQSLPPDSVYRIETIKGVLVEFQQSKEGPDYQSLSRVEVTKASNAELAQATAIRFTPEQIIHMRLGDDRKEFYPYGVSMIEAARGPAHQLRLMEDAMLVYRLTRAPERRVFYIDVGQLPPFRAEAFMERMKDQFRKKKVFSRKGSGASAVEERWHAPAQDEDYWIPIRPQANTRVETLPGACLALDTKIPLLDGSNDTLKKLIERWDAGEEMWAYSCNPINGEIVPGLITWAGVTRKNAKVVKVTFDNGESIICTPDHTFPVQGREGKIRADKLNIGDSMWPFRTRERSIWGGNKTTYQQVYDSSKKKWTFTHRMVAEYLRNTKFVENFVFNEELSGEKLDTVHHKDFERLNNHPNNLAWMNWTDHTQYHYSVSGSNALKISQGLKRYHKSLSESEQIDRNKVLAEKSKLGSAKIQDLLKNDPKFRKSFIGSQKLGWSKAQTERPELHKNRGKKIAQGNKERFANPEYKAKVFEKQTIKYPDSMFDLICKGFQNNLKREELIEIINSNTEIVRQYVDMNQHIVRTNIKLENGITCDHFNKLIKSKGFSGSKELRIHLIGKISDRSSQKANQSKMYGKSTLNFPKKIFTYFIHRLADGVKNVDVILTEINNDKILMQEWFSANAHVCRKGINLEDGIKRTHVKRMIGSYGYKSLDQARSEASLYNHTIINIEFLEETQDVGTITIDGNEVVHDFHTFAVSSCGIITYNSNLGEIDDALYFRNKLFIALNFPKNYLSNDDPSATRLTLSQQDVRFARLVERLQKPLQKGMYEVVIRHLKIKGYPEDLYENLEVEITPPSDWRKINRNEVTQTMFDRAATLKGSQLMADYDILTRILEYNEEEAKQMVSRMKAQKVEELRLQIIGTNPELLGINTPEQEGTEMGTQAGGPNPMIGGPEAGSEGETEQPEAPPEESGETSPKSSSRIALPEPEDADIKKYDLGILDYSKDLDQEEVDENDVE